MHLNTETANGQIVYVGTYSAPNTAPGATAPSRAEGIYVYRMEAYQSLSLIQVVPAHNPSFLTVNSTRTRLYCVNELADDSDNGLQGSVSAYEIDPTTGQLSFINTQYSEGTWPCHCSVDPADRHLLVANYGSGSFAVFPINDDGRIGEKPHVVTPGLGCSGPDKARQDGPHAHMVCHDPEGRFVIGVDLGADSVFAWTLHPETGVLEPCSPPATNVAGGCGPRHMVFHPSEKLAYVLNELSSTIDVFRFGADDPSLIWAQTISTLPEDTEFERPRFDADNPGSIPAKGNTGAGIVMHPSGEWLYTTNRGSDTVAIFKIIPATGRLQSQGWVPTKGKIPRGLAIDPSGSLLFVGNQNSDLIVNFVIDQQSGALDRNTNQQQSPTPVDFAFGPLIP